MTNQRLKGIARAVLRSTPLLGFGLIAAAAALAYTAPARHTKMPPSGKSPFRMVARPATRVLVPGSRAWYRISFVRHGFRGAINVKVVNARHAPDRFPSRRAPGKLHLRTRGQRVILTATSNVAATPGHYVIRLVARGGRYTRRMAVRLTIVAPQPITFTMAGNAGQLWPGMTRPINVGLTNPNPRVISVRGIVVAIRSVQAPRATRALPCTPADFSVAQFTGSYPLRVRARTTVRMSSLGMSPAQWPQLRMINRPVNQNGCQGATVILGYRGTATSP